MRDFVLADNQDLLEILRENKEGPMTVFMISDGAVNSLPEDTRQYLGMNTALLKEVWTLTLARIHLYLLNHVSSVTFE